MSAEEYSSKSLDHLGLVSGLCKELNIAEFIDAQFPDQSDAKHISYGQLLVAMILNGLGFVGRTLHMYPEYFADKPIERLIGSGIKAEHINDDALGRCLDKFYEKGVSSLYQRLGEKVVEHLGLKCHSVHLDSTSFHVDGDYNNTGDDFQGVHLTQGYSRDHRPELNQVILNLITENQAGLPVYMQACSGNTNDNESFKKLVKSHISSLKAAQKSRYLVADSSLYVRDTIQSLAAQEQLFITRVPQKIKEAKLLIEQVEKISFETLENGYHGAWVDSTYADVKQKWLLVKSEQAEKRECRTLTKQIAKLGEEARKSFKKLMSGLYRCESDARDALVKWEKEQKYTAVSGATIVPITKYSQAGRPQKGDLGEVHYQIRGHLYTSLEKAALEASQKGIFIVATNDCSSKLDMQGLLNHYKSQQAVEKGFRFLKSPDFLVSSLYLKKPERIEAFLMVMTCCLMIYAALEYKIRLALVSCKVFFPDMKKQPTQRPTARWVFQCFQGIHELSLDVTSMTKVLVLNLKERQSLILKCLGSLYQDIYL